MQHQGKLEQVEQQDAGDILRRQPLVFRQNDRTAQIDRDRQQHHRKAQRQRQVDAQRELRKQNGHELPADRGPSQAEHRAQSQPVITGLGGVG